MTRRAGNNYSGPRWAHSSKSRSVRQPYQLIRQSAGNYVTRDGVWTVVHNPAGWVAYRTDEPIAAERYDTLSEARIAIHRGYTAGEDG